MRPFRSRVLGVVLAALLTLLSAGSALAWDDGGVVADGGAGSGTQSVEDGGFSH